MKRPPVIGCSTRGADLLVPQKGTKKFSSVGGRGRLGRYLPTLSTAEQQGMEALPPLPGNYATGLKLIDEAHSEDPRKAAPSGQSDVDTPYELHYARKMSRWLALRCPEGPSPALQLACRAQHFRRFVRPSFPGPSSASAEGKRASLTVASRAGGRSRGAAIL